jgi:hypothetical protein
MNNPLQALIQMGVVPSTSFLPNSRYYGSTTNQYTAPNGELITYLERRFVPQPNTNSVIAQHVVKQGDRLDNISATYLGDPELFWTICDSNGAIQPDQLTAVPGQTITITQPQGVGGA